jgi:hypothetical protein
MGLPHFKTMIALAPTPLAFARLLIGMSLITSMSPNIGYAEDSMDLSNKVTLPRQLMSFAYDEQVQNWQTNLYPESLLANTDLDLSLNNAPYAVVSKYSILSGKTADRMLPITVSADGYQSLPLQIPVVDVNVRNGQDADIRFMAIGDSLTQSGYAIHLKKLANRLDADLGRIDVRMIGTRDSNNQATDTYKGVVSDLSADSISCEGYSGYSQSDILRHLMQVRLNTTSTSYLLAGKVAWDSLGLGTQTRVGTVGRAYTAWNPSDQQDCILVANTCHGWYDADPTPELWSWICVDRKMAGKSFVLNGVTHAFSSAYTTADDDAQKAYIKFICLQPDNHLYDYETVQNTGGRTALNLDAYLAKFRTMTDDGRRLCFDSTGRTTGTPGPGNTGYVADAQGVYAPTGHRIGSMVADTRRHDVCEPNYIAYLLGTNDVNIYLPKLFSAEQAAHYISQDTLLAAKLLKEGRPSLHLGVGFCRYYGVQNPDRWAQIGVLRKFPATSWYQHLHQTMNRLIQEEVFDRGADFSFIPTYYSQGVIGAPRFLARNLNTQRDVIYDSHKDQLHARDEGWEGVSLGVLTWIFSKL